MRSFCSAKASFIFSTENISVFGSKVLKHFRSSPLNKLVKLTMPLTTGPRSVFCLNIHVYTFLGEIIFIHFSRGDNCSVSLSASHQQSPTQEKVYSHKEMNFSPGSQFFTFIDDPLGQQKERQKRLLSLK